jgi:hypothetical protein
MEADSFELGLGAPPLQSGIAIVPPVERTSEDNE